MLLRVGPEKKHDQQEVLSNTHVEQEYVAGKKRTIDSGISSSSESGIP